MLNIKFNINLGLNQEFELYLKKLYLIKLFYINIKLRKNRFEVFKITHTIWFNFYKANLIALLIVLTPNTLINKFYNNKYIKSFKIF